MIGDFCWEISQMRNFDDLEKSQHGGITQRSLTKSFILNIFKDSVKPDISKTFFKLAGFEL